MANVKFAGDPTPGKTVQPVAGQDSTERPAIPLDSPVAGTTVEMLSNGQDAGDDEPEKASVERRRRPSHDEAQAKQDAAVKATFDPDTNDEDEEETTGGPAYNRETIGSRIGLPPEEANKVENVIEQLETEDMVPMMFQKKVMLNDRGLMHTWEPGLHLVPISLAGKDKKDKRYHWYLRAHKVRHAGPVQKGPGPKQDEDEDAA